MPDYSVSESLLLISLWAMGCLLMCLLTSSAYYRVTHRQFGIYMDLPGKNFLHEEKRVERSETSSEQPENNSPLSK